MPQRGNPQEGREESEYKSFDGNAVIFDNLPCYGLSRVYTDGEKLYAELLGGVKAEVRFGSVYVYLYYMADGKVKKLQWTPQKFQLCLRDAIGIPMYIKYIKTAWRATVGDREVKLIPYMSLGEASVLVVDGGSIKPYRAYLTNKEIWVADQNASVLPHAVYEPSDITEENFKKAVREVYYGFRYHGLSATEAVNLTALVIWHYIVPWAPRRRVPMVIGPHGIGKTLVLEAISALTDSKLSTSTFAAASRLIMSHNVIIDDVAEFEVSDVWGRELLLAYYNRTAVTKVDMASGQAVNRYTRGTLMLGGVHMPFAERYSVGRRLVVFMLYSKVDPRLPEHFKSMEERIKPYLYYATVNGDVIYGKYYKREYGDNFIQPLIDMVMEIVGESGEVVVDGAVAIPQRGDNDYMVNFYQQLLRYVNNYLAKYSDPCNGKIKAKGDVAYALLARADAIPKKSQITGLTLSKSRSTVNTVTKSVHYGYAFYNQSEVSTYLQFGGLYELCGIVRVGIRPYVGCKCDRLREVEAILKQILETYGVPIQEE